MARPPAPLSLALACDFRLVSRSAKLTTAFAKVALSGDYGGSWLLTRIVGTARARDLYLRPRVLSAQQALEIGLVTEVVDDDRLHERAHGDRGAVDAVADVHVVEEVAEVGLVDAELVLYRLGRRPARLRLPAR